MFQCSEHGGEEITTAGVIINVHTASVRVRSSDSFSLSLVGSPAASRCQHARQAGRRNHLTLLCVHLAQPS
jgi:hypothetical protein